MKWGPDQAERYFKKLQQCFNRIGNKQVAKKSFDKRLPHVFVIPCEHHYVFYLLLDQPKPVILAVFHERMNLMQRLKNRLS